jgi:Flp pilus assembly protein TadG
MSIGSVAFVLADRRGSVGVMFGLLAPLLVLTAAFGIDVTAWYRDAQHLQGLADRTAASAAPLWSSGDRAAALEVAAALVAVDGPGVVIDHAGAVTAGRWAGQRDAFSITLSARQQHLLAGLFEPDRQTAHAVAIKNQLVE